MCGRFVVIAGKQAISDLFGILDDSCAYAPSYNIAPTQNVAVILGGGKRSLASMRWGLIPSWATDPAIGNRMINARVETVAEKPAFRAPFKRKRCLIPASGFYEWRAGKDGKTPMHIRPKDRDLFAMAGLWDQWTAPDGRAVPSFAIITTAADDFMKPIHHRMPVILPPDAWNRWLDPALGDALALRHLLACQDNRPMEAYEVSRYVNSPGNNSERCLDPA